MKSILSLLLSISLLAAHADDSLREAANIDGVQREVERMTSPVSGGCPTTEVEINYSEDECGSRVPASTWRKYKHNLSSLKTDPKKFEEFFLGVGQDDPQAEHELREFHKQVVQMMRVQAGLSLFSDQLEIEEKISVLKKKVAKGDATAPSLLVAAEGEKAALTEKYKQHEGLKSLGYKPEDVEKLYENILATPMGKSLKKLRSHGLKYNPLSQSWSYTNKGPRSEGYFSSQALEKDPALKASAEFMFGDDLVKKMLDERRQDAIVLGDLVITPRKNGAQGKQFYPQTREDWTDSVKRNLDHYYRNIKEAADRMPKLGTIWDGWKLHSSRTYNRLVQDQFDNLNAAHVHVDVLGGLGFPLEERAKLSRQVADMGSKSAETVDATYQGAESVRTNLYIIAGGAALAATPGGQALLLGGLQGTLGYLAAVGAAVPFISEGVKAGVKVGVDGGSWWCQYRKRMGTAVTESAMGAISMAVIPGSVFGAIGKLSATTAGVLGVTFAGGMMAWGGYNIYGQAVNCHNVLSLKNRVLEDKAMALKNNDLTTANELQLFADEMSRQAGENCTNAVAGTVDLATGLASAYVGYKQGLAAKAASEEIKLHSSDASINSNAELSSSRATNAGQCEGHAVDAMNTLHGKYAQEYGGENVRFFDTNADSAVAGKFTKSSDGVILQVKVDGEWKPVAGRRRAALPILETETGNLNSVSHVTTEVVGPNGKKLIYDPTLADNLKQSLASAEIDGHPVPLDKDGNPLAYFTPEQHQRLLDYTWKLTADKAKGLAKTVKTNGLAEPYPEAARVLDEVRARELADIDSQLAKTWSKEKARELKARKLALETAGYDGQMARSQGAINNYLDALKSVSDEIEAGQKVIDELPEGFRAKAAEDLLALKQKKSEIVRQLAGERQALADMKVAQGGGVSYYSGEAYSRTPPPIIEDFSSVPVGERKVFQITHADGSFETFAVKKGPNGELSVKAGLTDIEGNNKSVMSSIGYQEFTFATEQKFQDFLNATAKDRGLPNSYMTEYRPQYSSHSLADARGLVASHSGRSPSASMKHFASEQGWKADQKFSRVVDPQYVIRDPNNPNIGYIKVNDGAVAQIRDVAGNTRNAKGLPGLNVMPDNTTGTAVNSYDGAGLVRVEIDLGVVRDMGGTMYKDTGAAASDAWYIGFDNKDLWVPVRIKAE